MAQAERPKIDLSRRNFVFTSAVASAGLVAGVTVGCSPAPTRHEDAEFLAFLKIEGGGAVRVIAPTAEMGQNVFTTLPASLVEELGADFDTVIIEHAPYGERLAHPEFKSQSAGASLSIRAWMDVYRKLGAGVRQNLIAEAASQWGVDPGECVTEKGFVVHAVSGNTGKVKAFHEIAAAAAQRPLDPEPELKPAAEWQLLGRSLPRKDIPSKIDGSAIFGVDTPEQGKLFAACRRPASFAGVIEGFEASAALERPGVVGVYEVDNAVAVVAKDWWTAHRALQEVDVKFGENRLADHDDDAIAAEFKAALDSPETPVADAAGDVDAAFAEPSGRRVEAEFSLPYLAHAAMEPMSALANVKAGGVSVKVANQNPTRMAGQTAEFAGVDLEQVELTNAFMGGGFGRRGTDFGALRQSIALSKEIGRPVHVIWDREEDTRHDLYRPASAARFAAVLNEAGELTALRAKMVGPSLGKQRFARPTPGGIDRNTIGGLFLPYDIPNRKLEFGLVDSEVPIGFWRAVSLSDGPFMAESFIDELAHVAGRDPYEFRFDMLGTEPRTQGVLARAAEASGWGTPLPEGRARGIAVQAGWGSYCAQVAEVSVDNGDIKVHRITAAVDVGTAIDPATVEAQIDSSVVYGLTAALFGRISISEGGVVEGNFNDYPMLRLANTPEIDVHIVDTGEAPGGVGELGLPPVAPAVANAVFAATGVRARRLPLSDLDFLA